MTRQLPLHLVGRCGRPIGSHLITIRHFHGGVSHALTLLVVKSWHGQSRAALGMISAIIDGAVHQRGHARDLYQLIEGRLMLKLLSLIPNSGLLAFGALDVVGPKYGIHMRSYDAATRLAARQTFVWIAAIKLRFRYKIIAIHIMICGAFRILAE